MLNNNANILVTGVTGGLGFIVSKLLLSVSINVIGMSRGSKPEIIEKLKVIAQKNKVQFDNVITDFNDPKALKEKLINKNLNLLPQKISHVAICHGTNFNAPLHKLELEVIDKSMRINFSGPFVLAQYFTSEWINHAKKRNKTDRSIIYISSVSTKGGSPNEVAYHSAKRAMESAMLAISREGAPYGIRANVISPGLMDTEMGKKTIKDRPGVLKRIPLGRLTGVEEVATAVMFLINSPSTTGQNIHINGGRYTSI